MQQHIYPIIAVIVMTLVIFWIFRNYFKINKNVNDVKTLGNIDKLSEELTGEHLTKHKEKIDSNSFTAKYSAHIVGDGTVTESNNAMSKAYFDGINENPAHPAKKSLQHEKNRLDKIVADGKHGKLNDIAHESVTNQPYEKA